MSGAILPDATAHIRRIMPLGAANPPNSRATPNAHIQNGIDNAVDCNSLQAIFEAPSRLTDVPDEYLPSACRGR